MKLPIKDFRSKCDQCKTSFLVHCVVLLLFLFTIRSSRPELICNEAAQKIFPNSQENCTKVFFNKIACFISAFVDFQKSFQQRIFPVKFERLFGINFYWAHVNGCFLALLCVFLWIVNIEYVVQWLGTAQKNIFSYSKCSEKIVFPKTLHWNMIFLVLSGKLVFFSRKYDLIL